jgi:hypothetical protein
MINVIDDYFAVFASVGEEIAPELSVYPNPANQQATLSFNSTTTSAATIEVYSVLGEKMISMSTEVVNGANKVVIDFSNLAAGQYIARVSMDATVLNVKFNIAH